MSAATHDSKPWYKTWKIIPALLFLPFTLMYLTWKTKWPMPAKVVIIGLILVSVIGASTGSGSETPEATVPDTEVIAETLSDSTEPSQSPTAELSTSERLVILAKDKIDEEVDLSFDEQTGRVEATIADVDYTFINETDMANSAWKFFVPFGREAFTYNGVTEIKVAITSEFIDQYGNSMRDDAVYIDMTKQDFELFNWDNLKFTNPQDNQELLNKSNYYVQGSIYEDVNKDKLKLTYF